MPIKNCPFFYRSNGIYHPNLEIKITNPHTGASQRTYGLIDTGADDCAIPAGFAKILGHNLQLGETKEIATGNGLTIAYSHTTKFEIYNPITGSIIYTLEDTPIDFMPNLHVVLLGVNNFLSKFILNIDYPNKLFSLRNP